MIEIKKKVYLIMIHEKNEEIPYLDKVFIERLKAENYCKWWNETNKEGFADYISEDITE